MTTKPAPTLNLREYVSDVPNFPKPGVMFRDISPLLRSHFSDAVAQLAALYTNEEWAQIDYLAGIEARGFLMAAGMAVLKNKGLVTVRKQGKLPGRVLAQSYGLEYRTDILEMQYGQGCVLVVDDVLATGGTLAAAADLVQKTGHTVVGFACLINLRYLNQFTWQGITPRTLIDYDE
jgi:adenine phosphoribosyltransferase